MTLELQLTDRCTHRCPWCIYGRSQNDLELALARSALLDAKELGAKSIIVSGGGEPLLHPDVGAILEVAREAHLHVCLLTNGEHLLEHIATIARCCSYVRISVDAGRSETYAVLHGRDEGVWHRVWKGIALLAQRDDAPLVGISYVVTARNCNQLEDLAVKAAAAGVGYLLVKHDVRRTHAGQEVLARRFTAQLKVAAAALHVEHRPPDGSDTGVLPPLSLMAARPTLAASGHLYPCCHLFSSEFEIADLRVRSLKEAWGSTHHYDVLALAQGQPHPCRSYRHFTALGAIGALAESKATGSSDDAIFF